MVGKLTKRLVESIAPAEKDSFVWDTEIKGFGVKISPAGKRIYILQTHIAGKLKRLTIGAHGPITCDQARQSASRWLGQIASGQDPAQEKAAAKQTLTVAGLAERYLAEHGELKKKPRSLVEDRRMLNSFIIPRLGSRKLDSITRGDVAKLHHGMRETPYQGNRVLALLSKMFNLAERWGLRADGSNPCRHVEKYREAKRERFLSGDELARLGQALADAEQTGAVDPRHVACFRLLLLTGCRLNEVLTLKWPAVDQENASLRLEDAKAGPRTVYLNDPAVEVLANIPRLAGSDFVLPGDRAGGHLVNVQKAWRKITAAAGLDNFRVHDMRHQFASVAAASGLNLPLVGRLLGHKELSTSLRYSHLAADPVRAASQEVGHKIAEALSRQAVQKVVPLPKRR